MAEPTMLNFRLSEQMVAVIGNLLDNAPHRIAWPILQELQKQIDAQRPTQLNGSGQGNLEKEELQKQIGHS